MTNDYKYHLAGRNDSSEARRKRICPRCGRKTFVLYIDGETGEPLHETAGKCDRLDHCAHHYTPKQYFTDRGISFDKSNSYAPAGSCGQQSPETKPQPAKPVSVIDNATFNKSLAGYDNNTLIVGLCQRLGQEKTMAAVRMYGVGTAKSGATIFWQIDADYKVRTGKVIHYKPDGHRNHDVNINWAHTALKLPGYNLQQCLFGLHLLAGNNKYVAIAEAEKTALVASMYKPDWVWLSCGGAGNLSEKLFEPLRGRKVILYPDAGMYEKWKAKALEIQRKYNIPIKVTDYLERVGAKKGADIADFLLRNAPPKATAAHQPATPTETPAIERLQPDTIRGTSGQETTAAAQKTAQTRGAECLPKTQGGWYMKTCEPVWDAGIKELEMFFNSRKDHLPASVKVKDGVIVNIPLFIESHLARVKSHNGSPTFRPYLDRLTALKNLLTN
jgi:hypothetical protein